MNTATIPLNEITKQLKGTFIGKKGQNINIIKTKLYETYFTKCRIDVQEDVIICKSFGNVSNLVKLVNNSLEEIKNKFYHISTIDISIQHQKNLIPNLRRRYRCNIQYNKETKQLMIIGQNKDKVIADLGIKLNKRKVKIEKYNGYEEKQFPSIGNCSQSVNSLWGNMSNSVRIAPVQIKTITQPKKKAQYQQNYYSEDDYSDEDDMHLTEEPDCYV